MYILCKEVFLAPDLESTEQDKPHKKLLLQ